TGDRESRVGSHGGDHAGPADGAGLNRGASMGKVREWLQRFRGTLRQNPRDCELEDELRLHLELAAEDASWREPLDDRLRAGRVQAGGLAQAMEALRD